MPEGPSIVILKEEVQPFTGKKILAVSGNSKIDQNRLLHQKVIAFKSWGKHFLICFKTFTVKVHLVMFGRYSINEKRDRPERLSLKFKNGELNLYNCSIKILEGTADSNYDFSGDVMQDSWDPKKAKNKLKSEPDQLVCDALLDQDIFAGVGNIIKNEVLYRIKVHPESVIGKMPVTKINSMVKEARDYSFEFLELKKKYVLKKSWLAHGQKLCLRCNLPIIRKHTGIRHRRSFFCVNCQKLYV